MSTGLMRSPRPSGADRLLWVCIPPLWELQRHNEMVTTVSPLFLALCLQGYAGSTGHRVVDWSHCCFPPWWLSMSHLQPLLGYSHSMDTCPLGHLLRYILYEAMCQSEWEEPIDLDVDRHSQKHVSIDL